MARVNQSTVLDSEDNSNVDGERMQHIPRIGGNSASRLILRANDKPLSRQRENQGSRQDLRKNNDDIENVMISPDKAVMTRQ